jgi:cytochrome bd-type quinol oxidase subunit 2
VAAENPGNTVDLDCWFQVPLGCPLEGENMLAKTLRFVSLLCAAVALGLTLTHDLEIAGKHSLDGAEWLHVQHTFYGGFAIVGGIAEVLGLISTCVLLVLLRGQQPSFILTLLAALSFLGMLALFAFGNNPLNQQIATWTPETLPANWQQVRDAWDRFHVISSVLAALAFTVLLVDLLRQMPSSWQQKHDRRSASAQAQ